MNWWRKRNSGYFENDGCIYSREQPLLRTRETTNGWQVEINQEGQWKRLITANLGSVDSAVSVMAAHVVFMRGEAPSRKGAAVIGRHMLIMALQLVDSKVETTRHHWRRLLGCPEDVVVDPREIAEIVIDRRKHYLGRDADQADAAMQKLGALLEKL